MIPEDSLTNLNKKHIDAMEKMRGTAFDRHYMDMMVNGHKKDVSEFQKASTTCNDAELKGWAGNKLPILKMHTDSAQSLAKMKM
jgi:putative membrane protein